jgi:hypothetical protein
MTPPSPWQPDPNRPKPPPAFSDWVRFWRELSKPGKAIFYVLALLIATIAAVWIVNLDKL